MSVLFPEILERYQNNEYGSDAKKKQLLTSYMEDNGGTSQELASGCGDASRLRAQMRNEMAHKLQMALTSRYWPDADNLDTEQSEFTRKWYESCIAATRNIQSQIAQSLRNYEASPYLPVFRDGAAAGLRAMIAEGHQPTSDHVVTVQQIYSELRSLLSINEAGPVFPSYKDALKWAQSVSPTKDDLLFMFPALNPSFRQGGVDVWYTRPQTRSALHQVGRTVEQGLAWAKDQTTAVENAIISGNCPEIRKLARFGLPPGLRRAAYALMLQAPDSPVSAPITPTGQFSLAAQSALIIHAQTSSDSESQSVFSVRSSGRIVCPPLARCIEEAPPYNPVYGLLGAFSAYYELGQDKHFVFTEGVADALAAIAALPQLRDNCPSVCGAENLRKLKNLDAYKGIHQLDGPPPLLIAPSFPSGIPPCPRTALLAIPSALLMPPSQISAMAPTFVSYLAGHLLSLSPMVDCLPHLSVVFLSLIETYESEICTHLREIGIEPLFLAVEWMTGCFASLFTPAGQFLLLDRILGYQSMLILPLCAVSVLHFRRSALLSCNSADHVHAVMSVNVTLEPIVLLQGFLLSSS